MLKHLKYGTDPEVFVCDNDGVLSPPLLEMIYGLKPITESLDHPVYFDNENFMWIMDGVAFELTIKKPLDNAKQMFSIINDSLDLLTNKIYNLDQSLFIEKKPAVKINPDRYLNLLWDERFNNGFIMGCDTDEDAMNKDYNCKVVDIYSHKYRYGGGHIHLSGYEEIYNYYLPCVQLLAITLGNFCLANSLFMKEEKIRSETYGKPGEKGVEYRSPSNSWLSLDEQKMHEMFWWASKGVEFLLNENDKIIKEYLNTTIYAITNSKPEISTKVLEDIK